MIDRSMLRAAFHGQFGDAAEPRLFRAPGRVNLIGEHTDYNDGFVLPMAIDSETAVAARANDSSRVRVHSLNMKETAEFELDKPGPKQRGIWLDYIEGVAQVLLERGLQVRGADMVIASDIPTGAGLSSSAALEISTGLALLAVSGIEVDMVELALAGQQAEHSYVGIKCGIMDQLVVACGRKGHALFIDCRSLEMTQIPFETANTAVVICDTQVKHELSSSEYNTRRAECEQGVEILKGVLPGIRALRDVSIADYLRHEEILPEPIRSRCRHVVTENERTLLARNALRTNDFYEMGQLMRRSHESMRDDFQISCLEIDLLVDIASSISGVFGARMTGGGFGGCTVNLVRRERLENFKEQVAAEYNKATERIPPIYISDPGAGAREIAQSL
jgi:galactokinase